MQRYKEMKEDYIAEFGAEEYARMLEREWYGEDSESQRKYHKEWPRQHYGRLQEDKKHRGRRGTIYYDSVRAYQRTGVQGERNKVRALHAHRWRKYKTIIAPNSELHHQWLPGSADYTGLAIVETNTHRYGKINVIEILEGEITLLRESYW